MPVFWIDAIARYRVDSGISLRQITDSVSLTPELRHALQSSVFAARWTEIQRAHHQKIQDVAATIRIENDGSYNTAFLASVARKACPLDMIWAVEAVTRTQNISEHLRTGSSYYPWQLH